MKAARLGSGELMALGGGIALFASLFLTWSSEAVAPMGFEAMPDSGLSADGMVRETGFSGWDALDGMSGFLIALAGLAGIALAGLTAFGRQIAVGSVPRGAPTAALGSLATALIVWQLFLIPGGPDGAAFLGLASAALVAGGGLAVARDAGLRLLAPFEPGSSSTDDGGQSGSGK